MTIHETKVVYNSGIEAAKAIGLSSGSTIFACCREKAKQQDGIIGSFLILTID